MKRIDKIYNYILEESKAYTIEDFKRIKGFSAIEISEKLGILRNNVSKELNELHKQDLVIKIKERPVRYFSKKRLEEMLNLNIKEKQLEIRDVYNLFDNESNVISSPFDYLIGADGSLKQAINQSKAAIMYPPNGLHTLILGETGVGKTLFANMMFNYAKFSGKYREDAPFIVFNCADYGNNPQLLLSHIFGHTKGAFTGADTERDGIVQKANGGILFLDEIHRLSPEGQEMIFYFMDTGTFNKLGENERKREANVLIIGATTEDPKSSLLATFLRRIPVTITIPSLQQRPLEERVQLIKHMFTAEASRVDKNISISREVIKALIGSSYMGNIGKLKSNIQLICATAFLNSLDTKETIRIDLNDIPESIQKGLFAISNNRREFEELSHVLDKKVIVSPQGEVNLLQNDDYELPFNLYKIIKDKSAILTNEGMNKDVIHDLVMKDIDAQLKTFYKKIRKDSTVKEKLLSIVDNEIFEFVKHIKEYTEKSLDIKYGERFTYAMSLHLSVFLKQRADDNLTKEKIERMGYVINEKSDEYEVAEKIALKIEKKFKVKVPKIEIEYLAILLVNLEEENTVGKDDKVAILVVAHGSSTALSMVNVAIDLLGKEGPIDAVDMPLDVSPQSILEDVTEKVIEMDQGKGVLLMVDMGSLATFGKIIQEKTNIKTRTLEMVTTPLVIEAVRKGHLFSEELDEIYFSLRDFSGYSNIEDNKSDDQDKAVITICSSGQGTAEKLKEIVKSIIDDITVENIEVIPIGIRGAEEKVKYLQGNKKILAIVGVKNVSQEIPFISLESFIGGNGANVLRGIISGVEVEEEESRNLVVRELCEESLEEYLTFLNPKKVIGLLMEFISVLEKLLNKRYNNGEQLRLIVHVACALERMVQNQGLTYRGEENFAEESVMAIESAAEIFQKSINIKLSKDEVYHICEII
ncbi:sigma 54-interacting transcriptional regulator [Clostridium paridis]|uniref:Sigma 54-interacting transcriptional regulator n=1 Tax=Clostridium paridis TaxID=2803863 RepID=A0A937K2I6_9CLOT|nr:sigma-54-dependent transcriptional regulator [Clostridium paridis]MBL4931466.1 sigma 54-interacting transcriptional regulator [Clostridium paridis]